MESRHMLGSRYLAGWLILISCLAGCREASQYAPPPPPLVVVAHPVQREVTPYLVATGATQLSETVEIRARVMGYLEQILFAPGDEVAADQILYVIDKKPLLAEREKARAALAATRAQEQDARAKYERAAPLAKQGAVSREELDEKAAALAVASARIQAAQADLEAVELELTYTDVRSPIAGRVGKTLVDKGNLVGGALATHLTTVVCYDPIYANFTISERELLEIRREAPARPAGDRVDLSTVKAHLALEGDEDFPHEGTLDYVDLGVESSTGTYLLRGKFPNPDRTILPGMFVRVRVALGTPRASLLVPEQAVAVDQAGRYVLVVNEQKVVERCDVTVGEKVDAMLVVLGGLEPDDRVIVEGVQRARPSAEVLIAPNGRTPHAAPEPSHDESGDESTSPDAVPPEEESSPGDAFT